MGDETGTDFGHAFKKTQGLGPIFSILLRIDCEGAPIIEQATGLRHPIHFLCALCEHRPYLLSYCTMDKIRTSRMLGAAFHKIRSEAGFTPTQIAARSGRSRDILYRLEGGKDISMSALLDFLRVTGHAIQIVPAGIPTMEQMRSMFKEDTNDDS